MITGKIDIKQIRSFAYHGVYELEKKKGAWFETDVALITSWKSTPQNLEDTLNYEQVVEIVQSRMQTPCILVETVCAGILEDLIAAFSAQCAEIRVTVHKPQVPINWVSEVAVTMEWKKKE